MSTPVSGTTAYCTGTQFVVRYDPRPIGALLMDDGTTVSPGNVPTHPVLLALLNQNSGKLESAIFAGGRYTPADLAAIIANPAQNNQVDMLAGIVADMTVVDLYSRRLNMTMPKLPKVEESMALLEAFARGERIFGLQEVMDSGREEPQTETLANVINRNDPSWQARRVFGRRSKWLSGPPVGGDCSDY